MKPQEIRNKNRRGLLDSKLQNFEREVICSAIIDVCCKKGKWQKVSLEECNEALLDYPVPIFGFVARQIRIELRLMIEEGLLKYKGDYLEMTPRLISLLS